MFKLYKEFTKLLTNAREAFSDWRIFSGGNVILGIIALFLVVVPLVIFLGSLDDLVFDDLKTGKKTLTCLNFETGERFVMDSTKINTSADLSLLRRSDKGCLLR